MTSPTRQLATEAVCARCGKQPQIGAPGPWACAGCNDAAERQQRATAELRAWKRYDAGSEFR